MAIFKLTEENIKAAHEGFMRGFNSGYCYECGVTANVLTCLKKYKSPPKKLCYDVSTYWNGECGICREVKSVTSERDFFYPDFSLLEKNWILKLKK